MRIPAVKLHAAALLFAAALGVRAFHLDIPFLEPFNNYSRQSMCASVARNFYAHGFNLFYPEIDENGPGPSLYNVEMPFYSWLMAVGYKLAGGVREWAARSVSVFFSMGFLAFLFLLVRRAAGRASALWALAFAAFSPMMLALSRSIQPDITMLCAGTGALYFLDRYRESGQLRHHALSAVFLWFAVLTRPFALYFFLPAVYLVWEREGFGLFKKIRHYAYGVFVLSALCWYVYMWKMGKDLELFYQPYRYSTATAQFSLADFLSPANLALPLKATILHLLTPLGALLLALGWRRGNPRGGFFAVWFGATALYLILIWRTAVIHPYYFLPLGAPAAYFVARGAERVRAHSGGLWGFLRARWVLGAVAVLVALNLSYYYRLIYFVPQDRMAVVEAGGAVDRLAPKGALVVAAYRTSPIQLYYCHRSGWLFELDGADADLVRLLESHRAQGAAFFMTTEVDLLTTKPEFLKYLSQFEEVGGSERYAIYDLGRKAVL